MTLQLQSFWGTPSATPQGHTKQSWGRKDIGSPRGFLPTASSHEAASAGERITQEVRPPGPPDLHSATQSADIWCQSRGRTWFNQFLAHGNYSMWTKCLLLFYATQVCYPTIHDEYGVPAADQWRMWGIHTVVIVLLSNGQVHNECSLCQILNIKSRKVTSTRTIRNWVNWHFVIVNFMKKICNKQMIEENYTGC